MEGQAQRLLIVLQAVTALAVDPPGARVITGGYDYDVKLWDFGGMQADFRPFRSFEPYENYHVSPSGGFFWVRDSRYCADTRRSLGFDWQQFCRHSRHADPEAI